MAAVTRRTEISFHMLVFSMHFKKDYICSIIAKFSVIIFVLPDLSNCIGPIHERTLMYSTLISARMRQKIR